MAVKANVFKIQQYSNTMRSDTNHIMEGLELN